MISFNIFHFCFSNAFLSGAVQSDYDYYDYYLLSIY